MGDTCPFTQMDEEKRRRGSLRLLQALFPERFAGPESDHCPERRRQDEAAPKEQRYHTAPYA